MPRPLICACVILCGLQMPSSAYLQPERDVLAAQRRPSDALSDSLWQIAKTWHVRIGFESVEETLFAKAPDWAPSESHSLTEALEAALKIDHQYASHVMGDVIVVRPKHAWTDAGNPLNQRVGQVRVTGATPTAVLAGLQEFVYVGRFVTNPQLVGTVSLQVDSGSVLDVLNRLTVASEHTMWVAHHRLREGGDHAREWGVRFELRDSEHMTALAAKWPSVRRDVQ
jgi:hypothetical protein